MPSLASSAIGAFARRAGIGSADAFFVRIMKGMIDPERTTEAKRAWSRFREYARAHPQVDTGDLRRRIIIDQFPALQEIGNERQRWLVHPLPTKNEPEKAVCFLTDRGQYTVEALRGRAEGRTNPKSAVYYGSIFALFMGPETPSWVQVTAVSIVTLISSLLWHTAVALFFSSVPLQRWYGTIRRPIDVAAGTFLVAFGARIALLRD